MFLLICTMQPRQRRRLLFRILVLWQRCERKVKKDPSLGVTWRLECGVLYCCLHSSFLTAALLHDHMSVKWLMWSIKLWGKHNVDAWRWIWDIKTASTLHSQDSQSPIKPLGCSAATSWNLTGTYRGSLWAETKTSSSLTDYSKPRRIPKKRAAHVRRAPHISQTIFTHFCSTTYQTVVHSGVCGTWCKIGLCISKLQKNQIIIRQTKQPNSQLRISLPKSISSFHLWEV